MKRLDDKREGYLEEPLSAESYLSICFDFVLRPNAFTEKSVKLEAALAPIYEEESRIRPKGHAGNLSLCGCTPPVQVEELLSESKFTFTVVEMQLVDVLNRSMASARNHRLNLSKVADPHVKQAADLFSVLVETVSMQDRFRVEEAVDIFPILLEKKAGERHVEDLKHARISVSWAFTIKEHDEDEFNYDLEYAGYDGKSQGEEPPGELGRIPGLAVTQELVNATADWKERRDREVCSSRPRSRLSRRLQEKGEFHPEAVKATREIEDHPATGPVTVDATIVTSLNFALVWSGIRITKVWIQNAVNLAARIILAISTGGVSAWVGPWFQRIWDRSAPWIQRCTPVSKRWRYQLVPYMYKMEKLTPDATYTYDMCDLLAVYAPWMPCWLLIPLLLVIAAITFLIQLRYCSCLTPFLGCWCPLCDLLCPNACSALCPAREAPEGAGTSGLVGLSVCICPSVCKPAPEPVYMELSRSTEATSVDWAAKEAGPHQGRRQSCCLTDVDWRCWHCGARRPRV